MARYGGVPPSEAAHWELGDLAEFAQALAKILEQENKLPPMRRPR